MPIILLWLSSHETILPSCTPSATRNEKCFAKPESTLLRPMGVQCLTLGDRQLRRHHRLYDLRQNLPTPTIPPLLYLKKLQRLPIWLE